MNHIRIRIEKDLSTVDQEFHRTIDNMMRMMNPHFTLTQHAWRPHADIFEMDCEITITLDLAGIDSSDIHVETDQRTLKIWGIRREQRHQEDGTYLLAEIPSGYFERTFTLSSPIDLETVTANYAQGFLHVRLKKRVCDIVHTIPVHSL